MQQAVARAFVSNTATSCGFPVTCMRSGRSRQDGGKSGPACAGMIVPGSTGSEPVARRSSRSTISAWQTPPTTFRLVSAPLQIRRKVRSTYG